MPNTQSRTNVPFLQKRESIDNFTTGRLNTTAFQHNLLLGNLNSAGSNTIISGDINLVADIGGGLVIGDSNNIISTGIIIGSGNTVSTNGDVFLFGVNGMSITQSVRNVYMFSEGPSPTQSGIYLNENVFLGPSFSIFNSDGTPFASSQNLNQVLTVNNITGGQDIEVTSGDLIKGQNQGVIEFDLGSRFLLAYDTSYVSYISIDNNNIGLLSDSFEIVTTNEENFVFNDYAFKTIDIGDWDMVATQNVLVPHGLSATERQTIKNIDAIIRTDNNGTYFPIVGGGVAGFTIGLEPTDCFIYSFSSVNIELWRKTGGSFDDTTFDSTSYNRGWIRFQYIPD